MNEKIEARAQSVWFALIVLFAINTMNFFDRQIIGAVGEPIRKEFGLDDASLGLLGTAFTLLYAFVGLPLGVLADKIGRKGILSLGVFVWSLFTAGSGLAQSFWQIFALRLGVGVGEASCAPAATSLIGDLFPASWRAKALAIFMLGLPVGVALSFAVSGTVAKQYGWRAAFFVAGIPGILCAIAVLFVREPKRGASETHAIGGRKREGSPYLNILKSPTMRWIIISGAVHNFNMYAIGAFITPFLMRYHGLDIQQANFVSMIVYGVMGAPGLLIGGFIGDAVMKRRTNGRMLLGAGAILLSVPTVYFALGTPKGSTTMFLSPDGSRLCPDVLLLFDRLFDHPGHRRTRITRHRNGRLFPCDVRPRSFARPIRHGLAERLFHQTCGTSCGCDGHNKHRPRTLPSRRPPHSDVHHPDTRDRSDRSPPARRQNNDKRDRKYAGVDEQKLDYGLGEVG